MVIEGHLKEEDIAAIRHNQKFGGQSTNFYFYFLPNIVPLEEVKLQSLEDEGQYRNGWLICTRGKSFAVYAATAGEKQAQYIY